MGMAGDTSPALMLAQTLGKDMNTKSHDTDAPKLAGLTPSTQKELRELGYGSELIRFTNPLAPNEDMLVYEADFMAFLVTLDADGYTGLLILVLAEVTFGWVADEYAAWDTKTPIPPAVDHAQNVFLFLNSVSEEL